MFNNKELERAVLEEVSWEPSVDSAHIGVRGNAGIEALTGRVCNFYRAIFRRESDPSRKRRQGGGGRNRGSVSVGHQA
jgi:hypothetical protein